MDLSIGAFQAIGNLNEGLVPSMYESFYSYC